MASYPWSTKQTEDKNTKNMAKGKSAARKVVHKERASVQTITNNKTRRSTFAVQERMEKSYKTKKRRTKKEKNSQKEKTQKTAKTKTEKTTKEKTTKEKKTTPTQEKEKTTKET